MNGITRMAERSRANGSIWFAVDGETGPDETRGGHVGLVTSSDGGATWREIPFAGTHEGAPCRVKHCYPDFYTGQDAVAADRRGNLVFVFAKNDRKQGPNALFVSTSKDGGSTWSVPAEINAAGNNTSPAVVAGPPRRRFSPRLARQPQRPPRMEHVVRAQFRRGHDRGAMRSGSPNRGAIAPYKHRAGYDFPFGDYLDLAVDSRGVNHVIWGEGSAVYVPGGTWWTRGFK